MNFRRKPPLRTVRAALMFIATSVASVHAFPASAPELDHHLPPRRFTPHKEATYVHPLPAGVRSTEIATGRSTSKAIEGVLFRRWIAMLDDEPVDDIRIEPFTLRAFARYFPNSTFYRLTGRRDSERIIRYGCETMGQALVIPEEINLLFILENREVNMKNLRPLTEIVVKLSDPEGATTFHVLKHEVKRHWRTDEIESITLQTWSYESRERKQWKIEVRLPYLYSMEEKLLTVRTEFATPVLGDEYSGPDSGHERYILFWRDPDTRDRMRAIRQAWHRERRAKRLAD